MTNKSYSVPLEAATLLQKGVVDNPLLTKQTPSDLAQYAAKVRYEGSSSPCIPINWRFAESVAALKGFEAAMVIALVKKKYDVDIEEVLINTDHAQLFFMSTLIWTIPPYGRATAEQHFPSYDLHRKQATHHRASCTNIYKTKDNKFFHLHGSMNPDPSLDSIGLPHELEASTDEESWRPFQDKVSAIDSTEMQRLASDVYKQAGTICWTTEEFKASEHYKANSHVSLYEVHHHPKAIQKPSWWQDGPFTSAKRPLGGLKVVDITRVIAAPAITRGLAELGASVMRVTAPHLADYDSLHCDLNWGKWNCHLDFSKEEDREKLRVLILEADVVVTAYRPYVLDKWGFGQEDILKLCEKRDKGVVYVRENCYGWNGPWAFRSGWQQISDACCGVSMEYGRAMRNDEAVTPVFPNSDYCTGISGVCGILQALMQRAEVGGSYTVDVALNYYSQWLINHCGTYPADVWDYLWQSYDKPVFRHYHNMNHTIPRMLKMLKDQSSSVLFRDEFFEEREAKNRGIVVRTVKPILRFGRDGVELKYNVGTRTNGVDRPFWPQDLLTEVVM